ncbi:MAG: hypothetical protein KGN02_03010 [bacterium]|nr:hypothetical protein [bacterium]
MARKSSNLSKKANAPLQPHATRPLPLPKSNARASFTTLIAASLALAAIAPLHARRADAFPTTPAATASPTPTASATLDPSSPELPVGARLAFVLDGTISSGSSRANDLVTAHLKDPVVLRDRTIVPAGTPVQIRVLDASPASNPDIYGFVDIYFEAMRLPDGRELPLRAPSSHLSVNTSAGHESTVGVENTVGDIFAPTLLLHVFRKGRNFTLAPGAVVHAFTEARIALAADGAVAVETPPPLVIDSGMPRSSFRVMPLATPGGNPGTLLIPEVKPSMIVPTPTPQPGEHATPPPIYQTPSP